MTEQDRLHSLESFWASNRAILTHTTTHRWSEASLKQIDRKSLGNLGERVIAKWAELIGYDILYQGLRHQGFELDIVIQKGIDLSVLEVKTRLDPKLAPDMNTISNWFNPGKRHALQRGIEYLTCNLQQDLKSIRSVSVDLIAVDIHLKTGELTAYRWPNILCQ